MRSQVSTSSTTAPPPQNRSKSPATTAPSSSPIPAEATGQQRRKPSEKLLPQTFAKHLGNAKRIVLLADTETCAWFHDRNSPPKSAVPSSPSSFCPHPSSFPRPSLPGTARRPACFRRGAVKSKFLAASFPGGVPPEAAGFGTSRKREPREVEGVQGTASFPSADPSARAAASLPGGEKWPLREAWGAALGKVAVPRQDHRTAFNEASRREEFLLVTKFYFFTRWSLQFHCAAG